MSPSALKPLHSGSRTRFDMRCLLTYSLLRYSVNDVPSLARMLLPPASALHPTHHPSHSQNLVIVVEVFALRSHARAAGRENLQGQQQELKTKAF